MGSPKRCSRLFLKVHGLLACKPNHSGPFARPCSEVVVPNFRDHGIGLMGRVTLNLLAAARELSPHLLRRRIAST